MVNNYLYVIYISFILIVMNKQSIMTSNDDFELINYKAHPAIKAPIAV